LIPATALVAALILAVIPAFAQDDSAGSPKSASPDQSPGLSAPTTGATVPRLVTFSGVVKNAGRKPVTGTVTVAFSLYEFSEGGSPLWVENQQVQPDVRCFREQTVPDGLPLDLFISGKARWLGVQPQLPGAQ